MALFGKKEPDKPAPKRVNPDDFFADLDNRKSSGTASRPSAAPKAPTVPKTVAPPPAVPKPAAAPSQGAASSKPVSVPGMGAPKQPVSVPGMGAPKQPVSVPGMGASKQPVSVPGMGASKPPVPTPKPMPAPPSRGGKVSADDFFGDLDKRAARRPAAAVKADIEVPEVTGLRDAPPPPPKCTLAGLSVSDLSTDGLRDKSGDDDGMYHGSMVDADISFIDTSSLRPPMELPEEEVQEEYNY